MMPDQSTYSNSSDKILSNENSSLSYPDTFSDTKNNLLSGGLSILDLFQIIFNRLHQLYTLDCAVLVLYDSQLSTIVDSHISYLSAAQEIVTETFSDQVPLSRISACIAKLEFPILKTKKEWLEQFKENHCLVNGNSTCHFHCYIPLESGDRIIGTMELHNYDRELSSDCLAYCINITDLLADCIVKANTDGKPVVSVTRATEMLERDKEQQKISLLLAELSAARIAGKIANEQIEIQLKEINTYKQQLEEEKLYVDQDLQTIENHADIVGAGSKMQHVFKLLQQVAPAETTVLILGETGTGKELIARAVHNGSGRKGKPMIKVNCAAIPPNLIESELFGHEKGSFTGATERRLGKFELAHHSTLFLDEIGELSLELQVKLLRVLQEKEIERVGGRTVIPVDVRIVSATNRNLLEEVEAGRFRRDLFYRLNVFPISLPALRKRKEDIPLLAAHFLSQFSNKTGKCFTGFSRKVMSDMTNYDWPGNIRELEHLIERQILLTKGAMIKHIDIPSHGQMMLNQVDESTVVKTIFENERDHIYSVLQRCKGKVSGNDGAAKLLGVPATTLNSKIKKLALSKKHRV